MPASLAARELHGESEVGTRVDRRLARVPIEESVRFAVKPALGRNLLEVRRVVAG